MTSPPRPSARTWALAVFELASAIIVAILVFRLTGAQTNDHHMHHMSGMAAVPAPPMHWTAVEYAAVVAAALSGLWWLLTRHVKAAFPTASALVVLAASPAVRTMAAQSHLVAMAALELVTVITPLLLLSALPRIRAGRQTSGPARHAWRVLAIVGGLLYAALLVGMHLPAAHERRIATPWWLSVAALAIGLLFWFSVLGTDARVDVKTRRTVLLAGQEVAALIGLLSLFGAWGAMTRHQGFPWINPSWDQRLGGIVMMVCCGAVTIPIMRRLSGSSESAVA